MADCKGRPAGGGGNFHRGFSQSGGRGSNEQAASVTDALRRWVSISWRRARWFTRRLAAYAALSLWRTGLDGAGAGGVSHRPGERNLRREENLWQAQNLAALCGNAGKCCFTGELSIIETIPGGFGKGRWWPADCGAQVKEKIWMARPFILTALTFWRIFRAKEEIKAAAKEFCPVTWESGFDFRTLDWKSVDSMDKTF